MANLANERNSFQNISNFDLTNNNSNNNNMYNNLNYYDGIFNFLSENIFFMRIKGIIIYLKN